MERPVRIVYVEDESAIRRQIQRILEMVGYTEVATAEDNATALSLLKDPLPDLILSDLNRPGGSGEDLLRTVLADPRTKHVPVVILTGDTRPERELDLWRMGIRAFLRKPIGVVGLTTALDSVLGQNRDADLSLIDLGLEGRDLEYKERIALETTSGRAMLAREVLAMANSGGGALVVGVADRGGGSFYPVGVAEDELGYYETTRLNDCLRRYVGSTVAVVSKTVRRHQKPFVIVRVRSVDDTLALALAGHEAAGLHPGRIYVRTEDARSSELTDPLELRRLIDRLVDARLRKVQITPTLNLTGLRAPSC